MRQEEFIGNPFEQEYEDEDEIDEFEFDGGEFLNTFNPLIIVPADYVDDDEEADVEVLEEDDSTNDPDYDVMQDINQDMDGYDSAEEENFEFTSDEGDDYGMDDLPRYNIAFDSDEDEDELDYVSFPADNPSEPAAPKPTTTESSNASSSDQEPKQQGEET